MTYSKIKKIRLSKYDKLWSKQAREKTPYCWYCGSPDNLNAHHFIRRSIKVTRLDLLNCVVLCSSHHTFNNDFSAHRTPEKFERWFKQTFPKRWKAIREKAKIMISEREAIKEFEILLKELE